MIFSRSKIAGITLMELILVVTILAIVTGVGAFSISTFFGRSHLNDYSHQVVQTLRHAQENSMANYQNSPWGVFFDANAGTFTFFKGATYAGSDPASRMVTTLPDSLLFSNVNFAGGTQVVFSKIRGTTAQAGSLELQENPQSKFIISVNAYGQIEIQ